MPYFNSSSNVASADRSSGMDRGRGSDSENTSPALPSPSSPRDGNSDQICPREASEGVDADAEIDSAKLVEYHQQIARYAKSRLSDQYNLKFPDFDHLDSDNSRPSVFGNAPMPHASLKYPRSNRSDPVNWSCNQQNISACDNGENWPGSDPLQRVTQAPAHLDSASVSVSGTAIPDDRVPPTAPAPASASASSRDRGVGQEGNEQEHGKGKRRAKAKGKFPQGAGDSACEYQYGTATVQHEIQAEFVMDMVLPEPEQEQHTRTLSMDEIGFRARARAQGDRGGDTCTTLSLAYNTLLSIHKHGSLSRAASVASAASSSSFLPARQPTPSGNSTRRSIHDKLKTALLNSHHVQQWLKEEKEPLDLMRNHFDTSTAAFDGIKTTFSTQISGLNIDPSSRPRSTSTQDVKVTLQRRYRNVSWSNGPSVTAEAAEDKKTKTSPLSSQNPDTGTTKDMDTAQDDHYHRNHMRLEAYSDSGDGAWQRVTEIEDDLDSELLRERGWN
ncbi:hypothetical protein IAT40_003570 [Kwoniella sp. CBS 6097]